MLFRSVVGEYERNKNADLILARGWTRRWRFSGSCVVGVEGKGVDNERRE